VSEAGSPASLLRGRVGWRARLDSARPDRAVVWLVDRTRAEPAAAVLAGAIAIWVGVFSWLVVLRHDRWRTIDFDLGIHDQAIWLLAHGKTFDTVRGLPVFGHHATVAYYLLVPLQWLGAGPNVWNVLQVIAIASGAIPLYLLARSRLGNPWWACALGVVWLLQPPLQFFAWETFHPEVMAMPFLLWAYWLGEERRWTAFAITLILAMAWKEDVSLLVIGLGVLYLVRGRRRLAMAVIAGGLSWFLVVGAWMVPTLAGGGTVYGGLYGDLGDTPAEVVRTGLRDPNAVIDRLQQNGAGAYARDLMAPFGFTPLAAPEVLLPGLPQATINLLSTADFTWDLRYHYQAFPMVALGIAMVEGVARIRRFSLRHGRGDGTTRFTVGVVGACALAATVAWGPSPLGVEYHNGYWPLAAPPDAPVRDRMAARIGLTDGVSADYWSVPHLTHRDVVYTFPNPWVNKNYGISASSLGDPAAVRWVMVDTSLFQPADSQLFNRLLASGEFVVRDQQGTMVLAERVRPPINATGPPP
jgi:uncharacterized membrane protein